MIELWKVNYTTRTAYTVCYMRRYEFEQLPITVNISDLIDSIFIGVDIVVSRL